MHQPENAPGAIGPDRNLELVELIRVATELGGELGSQAGVLASADFACSAIAPNAAGSLTARSASTFRSSSMPACLQPAMNWLYERSCCRAAALMRMIQSRRNVRFFALRSR